MQNLMLKTPYKFKNSYGGTRTPEPQTTQQDAPWLHGPSLKIQGIKVQLSKFRSSVYSSTVRLCKRKLAHNARAAFARGIS